MTKEEFQNYPFTANTWAVVSDKHYQVEKIDYTDLDILIDFGYIDFSDIESLYDKQPEPTELDKLRAENEELRKQLEAVQSEKVEEKVPVRDLPAGTIFRLHSADNKVYQRVKSYLRGNNNVCAIKLGSNEYFEFDTDPERRWENSTHYTIIPNPFKD